MSKYFDALYLTCGAACLTMSLVGTFGSMFSSIAFAIGFVILIDLPVLAGLIGTWSASLVFPMLVLLGYVISIVGVLAIYAHDAIYYPSSSTSFVHECSGWLYLGLNLILGTLTLMKITRTDRNGVTRWPK